MAERLPLEGTNIVVNCVCPGLCSSELVRDISGVKKVAFKVLMFALANTTEQGGRQLVNAALGSQGQETKAHGSFNQNSRINEPAPFVSSKVGKEFQDRLWVCGIAWKQEAMFKCFPGPNSGHSGCSRHQAGGIGRERCSFCKMK